MQNRKIIVGHLEVAEMLGDPWNDRQFYYNSARYTWNVMESVLERLADYLNHTFKKNYTLRYWRIILGPWLLHYSDQLYDCYVFVKQLQSCRLINRVHILKKDQYVYPVDLADYMSLISDPVGAVLYRSQIASQIMQHFGISNSTIGLSSVQYDPPSSFSTRGLIKRIINNIALMDWRIKPAPAILNGHITIRDYLKLLLKDSRLSFLPSLPLNPVAVELEDLASQRVGLSGLKANGEFEELLFSTLPENFPVYYLEAYSYFNNKAHDWLSARRPKVICSICGILNRNFEQHYAALAAAEGTRLINVQHGGLYGSARWSEIEKHERSVADSFWCWGWADNEKASNLKNIPSIKLSKAPMYSQPRDKNVGILVVANLSPLYLYRFNSSPVGIQWKEYLEDAVSFLQALGTDLLNSVMYRCYVQDHGWNVRSRLQRKLPSLTFDKCDVGLQKRMRHSQLSVFDNNVTTLLEALSGNYPSIIYLRPNRWELRSEAEPYYHALKKAGILFDDPVSAAEKVKEVFKDVDRWWRSTPVQEGREIFVKRMARSDKNWSRKWVRALKAEVEAV